MPFVSSVKEGVWVPSVRVQEFHLVWICVVLTESPKRAAQAMLCHISSHLRLSLVYKVVWGINSGVTSRSWYSLSTSQTPTLKPMLSNKPQSLTDELELPLQPPPKDRPPSR